MRKKFGSFINHSVVLTSVLFFVSGCMIVPQKDETHVARCEISSDRKTLKMINGHEDSGTFYSISGLILIPISGIVSGTYVAVNNVYHLGEELIVCGAGDKET